jgi:tryptophan-rich sensory protein
VASYSIAQYESHPQPHTFPDRARSLPSGVVLLVWAALCVGGGALIGILTGGGESAWYQALRKPSWTPDPAVFGPVWTTLYALMSMAAWRVWRNGGWRLQGPVLLLFLVQLALNFAWSPLFFLAHDIELALVDIVMLWMLIVVTTRQFAAVDRLAGWLLAPYLVWVTFATVLNAALVRLS